MTSHFDGTTHMMTASKKRLKARSSIIMEKVSKMNGNTFLQAEARAIREAHEQLPDEVNNDLTMSLPAGPVENEAIAKRLVERLSNGDMYTAIGDVLVAVNPYERLAKPPGISLYDSKVAWHYFSTDKASLSPHIFRVAAEAYGHVRQFQADACVLVTGESGAGKTESAKHLMRFVTAVSPQATNQRYKDSSSSAIGRPANADGNAFSGGNRGARGGRLKRVHAQLFGSSPLLEAFGNAQTERNDNSSRFGKYLELQFDWGGGVVGGKVTSYLLEKSRVISHSLHERSFHVFYQWCSGAFHPSVDRNPASSEGLNLEVSRASNLLPEVPPRGATHWRYLQRQASVIPGVDDAVAGQEVAQAMESVRMDVNQRSLVASLLGAVLALGEVRFEDALRPDGLSSGGAQVTAESRRWLEEAAHLLSLAEKPSSNDSDPSPLPPSIDDSSSPLLENAKRLIEKSSDQMAQSGRLLEHALTTHAVEFTAAGAVSPDNNSCERAVDNPSTWIVKQLGPEAAAANTDTLAKEVYKRLFLWIIDRINDGTDVSTIAAHTADDDGDASTQKKQTTGRKAAAAEGKDYASLGVLDIYGFELLESNGFEQLCINYANERLQQLAVALTLKAEQEEYIAEGISWAEVAYSNNLATVTLIEKARGGLFALIDEAGTLRGYLSTSSTRSRKEGTSSVDPRDAGLATSVMRTFDISDDYDKFDTSASKTASSNVNGASPGVSLGANSTSSSGLVVGPSVRRRESFCVKHYAGYVEYRYDGFVEKNEDSLYSDLVKCLAQHSTCAIVRSMWKEGTPSQIALAAEAAAVDNSSKSSSTRRQSGAANKQKPPSVSSQFKQQVNLLVATLSASKPHYVRCVKPNHHRLPRNADAQLLLHQVQYLGLAETVAVRRAGFCQRLLQLQFLRRYGVMSTHPDVWPPAEHRHAGDLCRFLLLGSSTDNDAPPNSNSNGSNSSGNLSEDCKADTDDASYNGVHVKTVPRAATERFRYKRLSQVLAPFGPLSLTEGVDFAVGKTKVYIKAPSTVSALEARRSAVLPFCATDINSQVRRYLAKQNYQAFLAQLEIVKGIARRRICVQRYRRAKAAALCLHAWARGFVARCSYKALVQRCKGGYSCAYGERRQRQQLKLKQGQQVDHDGNGDIGSNHHGGSGCSGSAVVVIAPREKPIPPRLWAPTLQRRVRGFLERSHLSVVLRTTCAKCARMVVWLGASYVLQRGWRCIAARKAKALRAETEHQEVLALFNGEGYPVLKHPSIIGWFNTSSSDANTINNSSPSPYSGDLRAPEGGAIPSDRSKSTRGEISAKPVKPKRLRCSLVYPSAFGGWKHGANSSPVTARSSPSSFSPTSAPSTPTESTLAAMNKDRKKGMSPIERKGAFNGGASLRDLHRNAASPSAPPLVSASACNDKERSPANAKESIRAESGSDDSQSDGDDIDNDDDNAGALALAAALEETQNDRNSGEEQQGVVKVNMDGAENGNDDDEDDRHGVFMAGQSSLQDDDDAADRRDREAGQTGGGGGSGSSGSMSRVGAEVWHSLGRAAGAVQASWHSSLGRAMTFGSNRRSSGGNKSAPQAAAIWALSWDVDSAFKGRVTMPLQSIQALLVGTAALPTFAIHGDAEKCENHYLAILHESSTSSALSSPVTSPNNGSAQSKSYMSSPPPRAAAAAADGKGQKPPKICALEFRSEWERARFIRCICRLGREEGLPAFFHGGGAAVASTSFTGHQHEDDTDLDPESCF